MIIEVEPGVFSILIDGVSYEVFVSGNDIQIGGHSFEISVDDPRQWKRSLGGVAAGEHASLKASMPGKVIRLLVADGDRIEAGQGVMVIEAMKMQNELKAPRAGRVTAINVNVNDSVNAGAILAVIE